MKGPFWTRRQLLAAGGVLGLTSPLIAAAGTEAEGEQEPFPGDGAEAVARLKAGNARFAAGKTRHAHESADWRKTLTGGQKPFATILGCSDSRVPPELVFDQGFGDLFVIRVAGNVIATDVVGSIAYAAIHLATPAFVVMGHAGCGAVTAALDGRLKKAEEPEKIDALIKLIDPALNGLDLTQDYASLLDAAVESNVRWSLKQLAALPGTKALLAEKHFELIGAVYELNSGTVRFLS